MNATSSPTFHRLMDEGSAAAWEQQWEQAAQAYRQALVEQPDDLLALSNLGMVLLESGDLAGALQTYQRAAALAPDDPLHLTKVAQVYERQGDTRRAAQTWLQTAELYLKQRGVENAVEAFRQLLAQEPENPTGRARLALIFEKTGRKQEAVGEYLALASILQRGGDAEKARQAVNRALQLVPGSTMATQALDSLQRGDLLPRPQAAGIGEPTEPLSSTASETPQPNPLQEALDEATVQLAELLFNYRQEEKVTAQAAPPPRRGFKFFNSAPTKQAAEQADTARMFQHLGLAVDHLAQREYEQAAAELERSVEKGLQHPAGTFYLAYLLRETDPENAVRYAQRTTKAPDFALGSQLLLGQIYYRRGQYSEAASSYLLALRLADLETVPEDQVEGLSQAYESLFESVMRRTGPGDWKNVCNTITEQLLRRDWRRRLEIARSRTESSAGSGPVPAAESILNAHSSQVIEAQQTVRKLAQEGKLRTATEEAFYALQYAPTYLPLHVQIAELLLQQGQAEAASEKFLLIARLYSLRGDLDASARLYERVVSLNPMDMELRRSLIDLLTGSGRIHDAVRQYISLAELYYRLAELDNTRQTYLEALKIAAPDGPDAVDLLRRIADLDMQRLDFRLAMEIYERLLAVQPGDVDTRTHLVDLNFRLGQESAAYAQADSYLSYLAEQRKPGGAAFLESLLAERPDNLELRRRLVEEYRRGGQKPLAIKHLELMARQLEENGNPSAARKMIAAVLALEPEDAGRFQAELERLGPEE